MWIVVHEEGELPPQRTPMTTPIKLFSSIQKGKMLFCNMASNS